MFVRAHAASNCWQVKEQETNAVQDKDCERPSALLRNRADVFCMLDNNFRVFVAVPMQVVKKDKKHDAHG